MIQNDEVLTDEAGQQVTRERQADYIDRRATKNMSRWQRFLIRRARRAITKLHSVILGYAYERDVINSKQYHILVDSFHKALFPEDRREQEHWS